MNIKKITFYCHPDRYVEVKEQADEFVLLYSSCQASINWSKALTDQPISEIVCAAGWVAPDILEQQLDTFVATRLVKTGLLMCPTDDGAKQHSLDLVYPTNCLAEVSINVGKQA